MSVISLARTSTRDSLVQRLVHLDLMEATKKADQNDIEDTLKSCLRIVLGNKPSPETFSDLVKHLVKTGDPGAFRDHESWARGLMVQLYYDLDEVITSTYRAGSKDNWEATVIGAFEKSVDHILDDPSRLKFFRIAHPWPEFQYYSLEMGARILKPITEYTDGFGIKASPQRKSVLCFMVRTAGALHQLVLSQVDSNRRNLYREQSRLVLKRYLPSALFYQTKAQTDYA